MTAEGKEGTGGLFDFQIDVWCAPDQSCQNYNVTQTTLWNNTVLNIPMRVNLGYSNNYFFDLDDQKKLYALLHVSLPPTNDADHNDPAF
jgi:hypothetical protein